MKIVVLGDLHLGARNASPVMSNFQLAFFEEHLIPYLEEHKITNIIQTGDLFDTRKFTNHIILNEWKRRFFDVLKAKGITFHTILGNHDLATKNSVTVNSPKLFLCGEYDNIKLYETPTDVTFDGMTILMMPWLCLENHIECEESLSTSKSLWCVGHFELDGFEMHRGQVHVGGMDKVSLRRFEQVISGHFHTRSESNNIKYVGTPYEMTWIDYGDAKGFHVLDTSSRDLEFVPNKLTLFNKLTYNDKDMGKDYYKGFDLSNLEDTYIKIVVVSKTDPYQFDMFLDLVYKKNPADLKIIEDMTDIDSDAIDDDDIEMEDTISLIESYIDSSTMDLEKDKMKDLMKTLYTMALEVVD